MPTMKLPINVAFFREFCIQTKNRSQLTVHFFTTNTPLQTHIAQRIGSGDHDRSRRADRDGQQSAAGDHPADPVRARADYAARQPSASVENFWNPTISKDWLRLDTAAQIARVEEILGEFQAERGLAPGSLVAVGVETNIRILIAFSDQVGYAEKPALLMDFERKLRAATGDRLEVSCRGRYFEAVSDDAEPADLAAMLWQGPTTEQTYVLTPA